MKKREQAIINELVEYNFNKAIDEYNTIGMCLCDSKKLGSFTASVIETENYYILCSYNTKIACIDKRTDTLYDALRRDYGYTSTSAQHIAKFRNDYGQGKWGVTYQLTWRSI